MRPISAHAGLQLHSTFGITKERSSGAMILAVMNTIFSNAKRSLTNSGLKRGLNP